jgi:hypothetical protein
MFIIGGIVDLLSLEWHGSLHGSIECEFLDCVSRVVHLTSQRRLYELQLPLRETVQLQILESKTRIKIVIRVYF